MPDFGAYFRKVIAEWRGQRERIPKLEATIRTQAETIGRLMTELSTTESDLRHETKSATRLQAFLVTLEQKYILSTSQGKVWLPEGEILTYLPLPLTTRENTQAALLPLAEWERFVTWAVNRIRVTWPYQLDLFDCGGMTRMLLGLAEEWAPGLACGWVELTSPVLKVAHRMVWLLVQMPDGTVGLRYIDATPRDTVPWLEGVFSEAKNKDGTPWRLDRMGL